ncbi:MAG: hypothetical protein COV10_04775 [Candidatus Vogelbacteria bacterium CG10_big_fil_rev_8_21_14_0_10_51_16]|uniref:Methyltransferase type 11 domain-containing protein n=1 Tax=Candidatus Vogelbacteria bacterium CG10_big_fil_rev_8_21_14_0_10_51_16 TaxID=1975045 RepID=A0A2H0REI2_9BACT|nr:MAG: hypothetical protein COV10_04775 [Candidatus Vogelbacteria bacterium CG10_big_fil_rev_8_21_14_0_10_51_16]
MNTLALSTHHAKVNDYYHSTALDYWVFWLNRKNLGIHFGYWDETIQTQHQSLLKLNEVLAKRATVKKEDRVLDAGCGYGGSLLWLADNVGCSGVGVSIVDFHTARARKNAKARKIDDRVQFMTQDFAATEFPDESFDVFWAIESVVHAPDKDKVVAEAYRLLRPGGRLIMAEYISEREAFDDEIKRKIREWQDAWAMPAFFTRGGISMPWRMLDFVISKYAT